MTHFAVLVAVGLLQFILSATYLASGLLKLRSGKETQSAALKLGMPKVVAKAARYVLAPAEICLGVGLLVATTPIIYWFAFILLIAFSTIVGQNLVKGRTATCQCFGSLSKSPIGKGTLLRDVLLTLSCGGLLLVPPPSPPLAVLLANPVLIGTVAALVGSTAAWVCLLWLLMGLLQRQGVLLQRVEQLEQRLAQTLPTGEQDSPLPYALSSAQRGRAGLEVGSPTPEVLVALPNGELGILPSLIDKRRAVLIFTDPGCGACAELHSELPELLQDLPPDLAVYLITNRTFESNSPEVCTRELIEATRGSATLAFQVGGTPSALIIGSNGRIASSVFEGRDQIRDLLRTERMGHRSEHYSLRAQPLPPTRLPSFDLPLLTGGRITETFALGSIALVVLWADDCSYCRQMMEPLLAWEATAPPGALLVVSSSPPTGEPNFRCPVALDSAFVLGTALGAAGTPAAVVVEGTLLTSQIATGAAEVMSMADGLFHRKLHKVDDLAERQRLS